MRKRRISTDKRLKRGPSGCVNHLEVLELVKREISVIILIATLLIIAAGWTYLASSYERQGQPM